MASSNRSSGKARVRWSHWLGGSICRELSRESRKLNADYEPTPERVKRAQAILDAIKRAGRPVNRKQRRAADARARKFAEVTGFRG